MRLILLFVFTDFFFMSGMLMLMLTGCAFVLMFVFMLVRMSKLLAFFFLLLSMHMRMLVRMPMSMRMLVSICSTHNKSSFFQAKARFVWLDV